MELAREAVEEASALAGLRLLQEIFDGPRQPPAPVDVADQSGDIDPIAPAENVLDRQQRDGGGSILLAHVGAEKPDEMIDAVAVVQLRAAARACHQPGISFRGDLRPSVCRKAPVLPGFGEGVRRGADGRVEAEVALPGPDVRAVAAYHERKVAEQADARSLARIGPLLR